jgi:hypothetical protein
MRNTKLWSLGLLGFAIAAGSCLAQTVDAAKFYKLEFVVKEVEGAKVVNSRSFFITAPVEAVGQNIQGGGSIRSSSRIPVVTGTSGPNQQFTYVDVGVNIDCKTLHEIQSQVQVYVSADISTNSVEPNLPAPVVRQYRWNSLVVAQAKKPTVIYASDDANSKSQMQLELTATPIL